MQTDQLHAIVEMVEQPECPRARFVEIHEVEGIKLMWCIILLRRNALAGQPWFLNIYPTPPPSPPPTASPGSTRNRELRRATPSLYA